MRKIFLSIISLMLLFLVGCTEKSSNVEKVTNTEKILEEFISSKGYKIIEFKGELEKYTLEKSKFLGTEGLPYTQIWSVQEVEPDLYFGKEIETYKFLVTNHQLEKMDKNSKEGVMLFIMVCENKIMGGYSYPNANVMGAYYSLEGKTLEEVTGLTFNEWQEQWKNKYK